MNKKDVLGRKIVGVEQQRFTHEDGSVYYAVSALTLDNGTRLVLNVVETPGDYHITISKGRPAAAPSRPTRELTVADLGLEIGERVEIELDRIGWVAGHILSRTDFGGLRWESNDRRLTFTIYGDSSRVRRIKDKS